MEPDRSFANGNAPGVPSRDWQQQMVNESRDTFWRLV